MPSAFYCHNRLECHVFILYLRKASDFPSQGEATWPCVGLCLRSPHLRLGLGLSTPLPACAGYSRGPHGESQHTQV